MRRMLLVCTVLLGISGRASAQAAIDLLPREAIVSIAIRDLDDLMKKGDRFLTDSEIRVLVRPSELFDQGTQILGIRKGYDRKAPAAVVLMRPEKEVGGFGWIVPHLVSVIPFTDADVMADNFGIPEGKLIPKIVRKAGTDNEFVKFATRTQKHAYLCGSEQTLQRIMKNKTVSSSLTAGQRKLFDQSDVLLHFGRWGVEQGGDFTNADFMNRLRAGDDAREREFAEQFAASLKEVQDTVFGFRLREGIDTHGLLTVPKGGRAAKLFASLRSKHKPSTLHGLPEGNVLLAQASSGDAEQQSLLTKALFNFVLEDVLINQKIVHHVDRLTYLGVFHEVSRHLQGNRLAVYQNLDEKKHGLFCGIAILDTEDAKLFVTAMRILAKMATADSLDLTKKEVKEEIDMERLVRDLGSSVYVVRQSANTKLTLIGEPALPHLARAIDSNALDLEGKRRVRDLRDRINAVAAQRRKELLDAKNRPLFDRPKLTFIANVEKRQEVSVDVIHVKLAKLDKAATDQVGQLLGPDWDKVRLGIVGNQIVVMIGSDVSLFEAALKNLQKGDAGLAGTKRLAGFHELASKERQFDFHASVEGIMRLISPNVKLDTQAQMTSVALTVGEQSLQLDVRVPTPEVRTIARKAQEQLPKN
jgi:hypothetical protein